MPPYVKCCILLLAIPGVICLNLKSAKQARSNAIGYFDKERIRRGALTLVRELLATAKAVPSITPVKLFYKKGGVRQAEKDFEALHPTGVKETANIKYGKVGDYNVDIKKFTPPGHTMIDIYSVGRHTDNTIKFVKSRIMYREY